MQCCIPSLAHGRAGEAWVQHAAQETREVCVCFVPEQEGVLCQCNWRGAVAIQRGVSSGQQLIGSCGATDHSEQQGR